METLIAEWMSKNPCPASNTLERLWRSNAEARGRITDVAVLTLESWMVRRPCHPPAERALLLTAFARRQSFGRSRARRLEIGLVVPAHTTETVEVAEVIDAHGSSLGSLELVPASSGYLGLAHNEAIDTGSFLAGHVLLRRPGQSQPLRRRPRRAVPMRRDELLLAWVECERVQLGEESLVLMRNEIAPTAVKLLNEIARPGFTACDRVPGLPDGLDASIRGPDPLSIPLELRNKIPVDLNVLQALSSSQLVLQGGLRLPGQHRKVVEFPSSGAARHGRYRRRPHRLNHLHSQAGFVTGPTIARSRVQVGC